MSFGFVGVGGGGVGREGVEVKSSDRMGRNGGWVAGARGGHCGRIGVVDVATVVVDVVGRVTSNGWVIVAIIASVMDVVNQRRRFSKDSSVIMERGRVIKLNRR